MIDDRYAARLRPIGREHLARTLTWTNDPTLARLTNRARAVDADEHERWFTALAGRSDTMYFAIELADGLHVGNVWLADIDRRHRKAEVRVIVDAGTLGRGVGPQALDQIARHAFETLGLHRVYAYVLAFNERARRAFEKAGFRHEGVLRDDRWAGDAFVDVHVLGRIHSSP